MIATDFLNTVYDILAQNSFDGLDHDYITDMIEHVDLDRNTIVFRTDKGKEFELQLVETYAPSAAVARSEQL